MLLIYQTVEFISMILSSDQKYHFSAGVITNRSGRLAVGKLLAELLKWYDHACISEEKNNTERERQQAKLKQNNDCTQVVK